MKKRLLSLTLTIIISAYTASVQAMTPTFIAAALITGGTDTQQSTILGLACLNTRTMPRSIAELFCDPTSPLFEATECTDENIAAMQQLFLSHGIQCPWEIAKEVLANFIMEPAHNHERLLAHLGNTHHNEQHNQRSFNENHTYIRRQTLATLKEFAKKKKKKEKSHRNFHNFNSGR